MKEIVLKHFKKEAYKASYAWCCMQEAKGSEREAMRELWNEHRETRWLYQNLLEEAGTSKGELWEIEAKASGEAYEDYKRDTGKLS